MSGDIDRAEQSSLSREVVKPVLLAPSVTVRARDDVWARRWLALGIAAALAIALPLIAGHRGTHMALNVLLPGAGLFGVDPLGAVAVVARRGRGLRTVAALGDGLGRRGGAHQRDGRVRAGGP